MAARHYFHCFAATSPGQAAADVHAWTSTPNADAVRSGRFEIWYMPSQNADENDARYLLSCDDGAGETLAFAVLHVAGAGYLRVLRNGAAVVDRLVTYEADATLPLEMRLVFDAVEGSVSEYVGDTLIGTTIGAPWDMGVDDCAMRLGGLYGHIGSEARGLVSLPYAVRE